MAIPAFAPVDMPGSLVEELDDDVEEVADAAAFEALEGLALELMLALGRSVGGASERLAEEVVSGPAVAAFGILAEAWTLLLADARALVAVFWAAEAVGVSGSNVVKPPITPSNVGEAVTYVTE
jgi:hypothetical protein